jgi:sulfoxide reductase heme-binding subunit YedZ
MLIWYIARGAGVAAFAALSLATAVGAYASRSTTHFERRVIVQYLHRAAALSGISLLVIHISALLLDSYAHVGVLGATVPFASGYRPAQVTLGLVAMYLFAVVAISGAIRSRFARSDKAIRAWRSIHLASYAAWALSAWHFLVAGTDAHQAWARFVLLGGIGIVGLGVTARLADAGLVATRNDAPARVAR